MIKLNAAVNFSSKRTSTSVVNLDNYISIDNILQNKAGISSAVKLPPSNNDMGAYDPGHILVGNIRPYLKKIWFSDRSGGCSADVLNFEVNERFDPKFVYYAMLRDDFFIHMMKGSKGSKMPRGDKNQILDFIIPDFDLPKQHKIVSVLSVLDSKIDFNNKINTELEALAKTIYDYWFVQFDFPDENGKPYKSSGGKVVWNAELKREIPVGWKVDKLNSQISIGSGYSFKSRDYCKKGKYRIVTIKNVQDGNLDTSSIEKIDFIPNDIDDFCKLSIGDILISLTGNVGRTALVDQKDLLLNQRVGKFLGSKEYLIYSYLYFNRPENQKRLENIANGSSQANLSPIEAVDMYFAVPSERIMYEFFSLVNPIFSQLLIKKQESNTLVETRDWLLPMLMNGQVKVAA